MARRYQPMAPFHLSNLPVTLEAAGHIWRNYADARSSYFDHIVGLVKHPWSVPAANFDTDAKAGKLPDVSWLFAPDGLSEHPGDFKHTGKPMVSLGMQWTDDRVHAAATGPLWAKTAIFITWDDWGGWYDHVVPPLASTWPGGGHAGYQNSQFRHGPRALPGRQPVCAARHQPHLLFAREHRQVLPAAVRAEGMERAGAAATPQAPQQMLRIGTRRKPRPRQRIDADLHQRQHAFVPMRPSGRPRWSMPRRARRTV